MCFKLNKNKKRMKIYGRNQRLCSQFVVAESIKLETQVGANK